MYSNISSLIMAQEGTTATNSQALQLELVLSLLASHASSTPTASPSSQTGRKTISTLVQLCGHNLTLSALDLVDRNAVSKLTVSSTYRPIYLVQSSSPYRVILDDAFADLFPTLGRAQNKLPTKPKMRRGGQYCPCPFFNHSVLVLGSHFICKHLLAAYIAICFPSGSSPSSSTESGSLGRLEHRSVDLIWLSNNSGSL
ncbi:hypothetical protein T439DRAFT_231178 [Meredithblackwellia eburnea MCA 4105]